MACDLRVQNGFFQSQSSCSTGRRDPASHVGAEALKSDLRNEPGHTEVTEMPAFTMRRHYHPHAHAAVPSDLGALLCAVTASHT